MSLTRRSIKNALYSVLFIVGGFAFGVTPVQSADTFVFTAIPDQDESALRKRFNKIADYLSKELGIKTKYIPVKSYGAAVTAFAAFSFCTSAGATASCVTSGVWRAPEVVLPFATGTMPRFFATTSRISLTAELGFHGSMFISLAICRRISSFIDA